MGSGVLLLQSGNNLCGGVTPECSTAERTCKIYSLSYSLTWSYLVPIYLQIHTQLSLKLSGNKFKQKKF